MPPPSLVVPVVIAAGPSLLLQLAALGRWRLTPGELSDVLWGLANARHWTELLPQLDAALVAAGGVQACKAHELVAAVWAFASLGHTPRCLLQDLQTQGWAVQPTTVRRQKMHQQQQRQQQQRSSDSNNGLCRLQELSDGQLTTLLWSLACLEQAGSCLFKNAWAEACMRGARLARDPRHGVQIQQAALAAQLEAGYSPEQLAPTAGVQVVLFVLHSCRSIDAVHMKWTHGDDTPISHTHSLMCLPPYPLFAAPCRCCAAAEGCCACNARRQQLAW
jgi:hypothetical protein